MRIIGGKDYYDSGLRYGIYQNIVFVRHKDRKIAFEDLYTTGFVENTNSSYNVDKGFHAFQGIQVLFCGKLYLGIKIQDVNQFTSNKYGLLPKEPLFIWSCEEWTNLVEKEIIHSNQKIDEKAKNYILNQHTSFDGQVLKYDTNYTAEMVEKRITIATSMGKEWLIDSDNLKTIQFFKAKPHHEAFIEIQNWISGVLANNNTPPDTIDDETKIHKHGFDRFSFRKEKAGK